MDAGIATVIAAVVGSPVIALLVRFDKRNTEQHGANMRVLNEIGTDVKEVKHRLNTHIDWHAHND